MLSCAVADPGMTLLALVGVETDVNVLFNHLRRFTGSAAPEKHGPAKPGESRRSVLAAERAAQLLGWRPEVKIEDGLRQTVEFFRTRTHGH